MLPNSTILGREMLDGFREKLLSDSWLAAEIMYIACKVLSTRFYAKVVFLGFNFFPLRLKSKSHKDMDKAV